MQAEVSSLETDLWQQHYNKAHYNGQWTVLPLRSIDGKTDNAIAVHASAGIAVYHDTPLLERCAYIQSVLSFFACEKTAVRLMKLHAGAEIKEHKDHDMNFEKGEVRFHVPIVTNPDVAFWLDDERIIMKEGECWYLNLSLLHRVKNAGDKDRIHLVIDCKVNAWIERLFAENARVQKHTSQENESKFDLDTRQKIIRELRTLNTPAAIALANKMENDRS